MWCHPVAAALVDGASSQQSSRKEAGRRVSSSLHYEGNNTTHSPNNPSVNPLNLGRHVHTYTQHMTSPPALLLGCSSGHDGDYVSILLPILSICTAQSNCLMSNSAPSGEPVECFVAWVGLLKLFVGWCNCANEAAKAAGCCGGSTCRDTLTRSHIPLRVSWLWLWCEAVRVCVLWRITAAEVINKHSVMLCHHVASFEVAFTLQQNNASGTCWCVTGC